MQKRNSNSRIQIASREKKRTSGKSLNINHNKKLVKKLEKELLSKIDNILIEYQLNNDLIPTFAENPQTNNNKIPLKQEEQKIEKDKQLQQIRPPSAEPKLKQIKMPKATKNLDFDQNMPNINISMNELKKEKKLPKVRKKKSMKNHKDGFLTGVGLIKTKKKEIDEQKEQRKNRFMEENDRAINEMLHNIDEIDDFINDPEKTKDAYLFEGSPDYKERMAKSRKDFEDLIKEIDGYKKEMQDEFDIIQYLIKFTNNTEKLITRHKNVINGIFKGAGLQKTIINDQNDKNGNKNDKNRKTKSVNKGRIQQYLDIVKEVDKMEQENMNGDDSEIYDDEFLTSSVSELNGVFYKMKKINQIKDNLSNIQDDCLGYHEKLRDTLKRSQSARPQNRKDLNNENEEQKI
jgi:hypothetical protein